MTDEVRDDGWPRAFAFGDDGLAFSIGGPFPSALRASAPTFPKLTRTSGAPCSQFSVGRIEARSTDSMLPARRGLASQPCVRQLVPIALARFMLTRLLLAGPGITLLVSLCHYPSLRVDHRPAVRPWAFCVASPSPPIAADPAHLHPAARQPLLPPPLPKSSLRPQGPRARHQRALSRTPRPCLLTDSWQRRRNPSVSRAGIYLARRPSLAVRPHPPV